jgi:hypothetical protein
MRAIDYQPCRCLCLGFLEQMMRTTPWRLITLQCSQIGLTLLRTFTKKAPMDVQIPLPRFFSRFRDFGVFRVSLGKYRA